MYISSLRNSHLLNVVIILALFPIEHVVGVDPRQRGLVWHRNRYRLLTGPDAVPLQIDRATQFPRTTPRSEYADLEPFIQCHFGYGARAVEHFLAPLYLERHFPCPIAILLCRCLLHLEPPI